MTKEEEEAELQRKEAELQGEEKETVVDKIKGVFGFWVPFFQK